MASRMNSKIVIFIILVQLSSISILINTKTLRTYQTTLTIVSQQGLERSVRTTLTEGVSILENTNFTSNHWIQRIQDYCWENRYETLVYPNKYYLDEGVPSWVWMVSRKHRLFYCAAPKCSSTTWKSYLMEDLGVRWKGDVHRPATRLGLKQVVKNQQMEQDYIKFIDAFRPSNRLIIVRNPWARLVSAYNNKLLEEHWNFKTLCKDAKTIYRYQKPTFEEFVKCLARVDRSVMWNSHVQPIVSLCALCHMDYNIIVKMEEMESAEPFILDKLNSTKRFNYQPPEKGRFTNTYSKYYQNVPPEVLMELQDIYKYDIELFQYPASPFD